MFRNIFYILLLFVTINLFGQNNFHSIYVKGKITIDNSSLHDVKINILVNKINEKTIINDNNGEYNFTLEPAKNYIIEYTKQDFVTKLISISTKEVTKDEIKYGMFPLTIDIELFENFEGLNTEALKQPVAKWSFSDYEGDFVNDVPYSLSMKEKADNVKSQMIQLKKQAYNKLILSADNSYKNKELENAWLDYVNSLKLSPKETYPRNQISEIKRLINEKISNDEAYNRSIERADKHFGKKNYKNALGFYKKSLLYKPSEKYPQSQISEIEIILAGNNDFITKVETTDNSDNLFDDNKENNVNDNKKDSNKTPENYNITNNIITRNNKTTTTPKNNVNNIITNNKQDTLISSENIKKLNQNINDLLKSGNKEELAKSYYNVAVEYYNTTDFDKSIDYYNLSYKTNEQLGFKKINASLAEEIATVYENVYRYSKAIEYYNKSLSLYNELNDNKSASKIAQKIGDVNYISGNYIDAINNYKKSINIEQEIGSKTDISGKLNSIGISYFQAENFDEAIKYFQQSINIAEEIGNNAEKSMSLNNIGNVNYEYNNFNDALNFYSQSISLKKQIDYKKGIAITLHNIGNVYKKLKQFDKSLQYFMQSSELAENTKDKELICENYFSLSGIYSSLKDCAKALDYYKLYASSKHFITRNLSHDQLVDASFLTNEVDINEKFNLLKNELQHQQILAKYESEKNSKEIAFMSQQAKIHRLELIKKEQNLNNQQILTVFSLISLIIFIFLASMFYRQYKGKKTAYNRLEEQNEEINIQKEEIETQRDLVIEQKEKLETIHSELTSSIRYAQRIQTAVLPTKEQMNLLFENNFVFYKPRDIVSGDFYWTTQITTKEHAPLTTRGHAPLLIVAVADCTGHGVPGAFMSILGISLLDEIVRKEQITTPNVILNKLRENIISSLQQKNIADNKQLSDNVYDGMDIAICVINYNNMEMQFAGANSPLYIIRGGNLTGFENLLGLEEIKGDKMPIGMYTVMKPFNNHIVKVNKGDLIYLFSDGFADQFGGPKGRKFLHSQLKDMLLKNAHLSINEQKEILETTYNNWRGNLSQVDDIIILGIKV
ncbi:MAG: hypothetical protein A2X08_04760 [Bacteroidetes bacterium GWA2_32_17]|nr:MAG: hypothetical protein A2X08_04760 [Bacteroidetes bacterium GWA2_32_17]